MGAAAAGVGQARSLASELLLGVQKVLAVSVNFVPGNRLTAYSAFSGGSNQVDESGPQ